MFEFLYWSSRGLLEGWIWANDERKETNGLIIGNKLPTGSGLARKITHALSTPWDYHMVRVFEVIGILGMLAVTLQYTGITNEWWSTLVGGGFISIAFYEAILNYVNNGVIIKESSFKWKIGGLELPWPTGYRGLLFLVFLGHYVWYAGF